MLRLEVLGNLAKAKKLNIDAVVQLQIKRLLLASASQYELFLMLSARLLYLTLEMLVLIAWLFK